MNRCQPGQILPLFAIMLMVLTGLALDGGQPSSPGARLTDAAVQVGTFRKQGTRWVAA